METAWRAGRKPARGGLSNLICIAEPLYVLAAELTAVADRITIILPWGSLLRAVATPELDSLREIAHLCLPGASVEIVLSYDERDTKQGVLAHPGTLNDAHIANLTGFYEQAGLLMVAAERLPQRELAGYQTTWSRRLAFGQDREVWCLRTRRAGCEMIG